MDKLCQPMIIAQMWNWTQFNFQVSTHVHMCEPGARIQKKARYYISLVEISILTTGQTRGILAW